MRSKYSNILHIIVISYMLLALVWWSLLLFKKNNENYYLQLQLQAQNKEIISQKFEKQKRMIIGESIFFGLALMTGIWLINRAYRKEIEANTKQNNFLLSITHELKSPLASIKLILQTLIKRKLDPVKADKLANNALDETERLELMFGNILLATKIDHSYQYNFELLELSQLITSRIEIYKSKFPGREIIQSIDSFISVEYDRESFISILANLIENAHKYSPIDQPIEIKLFRKEGLIYLQVIDKGKGISNSELKKVFDKFYRSGTEESRKSKGSGLGLYIVKRIVDDHQGKISIKNQNGIGTIFEIIFNNNLTL